MLLHEQVIYFAPFLEFLFQVFYQLLLLFYVLCPIIFQAGNFILYNREPSIQEMFTEIVV